MDKQYFMLFAVDVMEVIGIVRYLFNHFKKSDKDILTLLIDKKCDVNISDNNSLTPLHIACYKGNVALVEILLRNKCFLRPM
jgi:ankyrin repeat protein